MSIETKIRNLITEINEATGQNDSNLSNAIATLKKGYLGDAMLQSKRVNVTQNGAKVITPDEGYNALSQVILTTSVTEEELEEGFHAYYVEYDPAVADYRKVWICKVSGGEVITVRDGADVPESNVGTKDYNPALKFAGWSCPLAITNNQITLPDVICADVYIGAIYETKSGLDYYVTKSGDVYNTLPQETVDVNGIYYAKGHKTSENYEGFSHLERIVFSSTLTKVATRTFRCLKIKNIVLPCFVATIDQRAFMCTETDVVLMPYSLTTVALQAFYSAKVSSIFLPENVSSIAEKTFYRCSGIRGIHIESPSATYGTSAFAECYYGLKTLKLSDEVDILSSNNVFLETYPEKVFSRAMTCEGHILRDKNGVISLIAGRTDEEVVLDGPMNGSLSLRWDMFQKLVIDHKHISKVWSNYAPHSLFISGTEPMSDFTATAGSGYMGIFTNSNADYLGRYLLAYLEGETSHVGAQVFAYAYGLKMAKFPNAQSIGDYSFFANRTLASVYFPEVKTIGAYALAGNTNLRNAEFPRAEVIGEYAFSCSCSRVIKLPAVCSIGNSAFGNRVTYSSTSGTYDTRLSTSTSEPTIVYCGPNLMEIGTYAFNYGSSNSEVNARYFKLYLESIVPPTLAGPLCYNTKYCIAIFVPIGHEEAYKAATNWSTYSSLIQPLDYLVDDSTVEVTFSDADGNVVGTYTHTEEAGSKNTSLVLTKAIIEANASGYTADEQTITFVDGETKEVTITVTK